MYSSANEKDHHGNTLLRYHSDKRREQTYYQSNPPANKRDERILYTNDLPRKKLGDDVTSAIVEKTEEGKHVTLMTNTYIGEMTDDAQYVRSKQRVRAKSITLLKNPPIQSGEKYTEKSNVLRRLAQRNSRTEKNIVALKKMSPSPSVSLFDNKVTSAAESSVSETTSKGTALRSHEGTKRDEGGIPLLDRSIQHDTSNTKYHRQYMNIYDSRRAISRQLFSQLHHIKSSDDSIYHPGIDDAAGMKKNVLYPQFDRRCANCPPTKMRTPPVSSVTSKKSLIDSPCRSQTRTENCINEYTFDNNYGLSMQRNINKVEYAFPRPDVVNEENRGTSSTGNGFSHSVSSFILPSDKVSVDESDGSSDGLADEDQFKQTDDVQHLHRLASQNNRLENGFAQASTITADIEREFVKETDEGNMSSGCDRSVKKSVSCKPNSTICYDIETDSNVPRDVLHSHCTWRPVSRKSAKRPNFPDCNISWNSTQEYEYKTCRTSPPPARTRSCSSQQSVSMDAGRGFLASHDGQRNNIAIMNRMNKRTCCFSHMDRANVRNSEMRNSIDDSQSQTHYQTCVTPLDSHDNWRDIKVALSINLFLDKLLNTGKANVTW
eukprot:CFRG2935T1